MMNRILKVIEAFKPGIDVYQKPVPDLPSLERLKSIPLNERELEMCAWEKSCQDVMKHNEESFNRALIRISVCAFLNPFAPNRHYSWCPYDEWHSKTPKIP